MHFPQPTFPHVTFREARFLLGLCRPGIRFALFGAIALVVSSCGADSKVSKGAEKWLRWHPALSKAQERNVPFEFEVMPRGPGIYELKGSTALPEGSQLAIAALRYLKLDPDAVSNPLELEDGLKTKQISTFPIHLSPDTEDEPAAAQLSSRKRRMALKPSYIILDYQPVTVQEGQWQTELNLWQVAKDGRYQESWQLHQEKLALQWKAEPEVIFLATLLIDGAADRLQVLQNQLAERQLILNRTLIQTSLEGEQYFQSMQLLKVALPQSKTAPPPLQVQDINGGWGRRYLLVEQDPLPGTLAFPDQRHSDAPGSPQEFIQ